MQPRLHRTKILTDRGGQIKTAPAKFVLDFGVQILERLSVQIFVRLAWLHVKETPKRTNFWHRSKTRPAQCTPRNA